MALGGGVDGGVCSAATSCSKLHGEEGKEREEVDCLGELVILVADGLEEEAFI